MTPGPLTWIADGIAARIAPGSKASILWIHGYTLDSTIWEEVWGRLPGWRHIGIDLPGHGASAPAEAGESFPDFAERLAKLALAHDVRHVVGLSFGATVALQMAIQMPRAFASLVLAAPGVGGGPADCHAQTRRRQLRHCYRQRGAGPWMTELWMTSPPDLFKGASAHPPLWERLREIVDRHSWRELETLALERWHQHRQQVAEMRRIRTDTLMLLGDDEMAAFKRTGELVRRSLPSCQRCYVPRAGHLAPLELPAIVCPLLAAVFAAAEVGNGDDALCPTRIPAPIRM